MKRELKHFLINPMNFFIFGRSSNMEKLFLLIFIPLLIFHSILLFSRSLLDQINFVALACFLACNIDIFCFHFFKKLFLLFLILGMMISCAIVDHFFVLKQ